MIRTQVQIPDELYEKAKRFSHEREVSLAEVVRRGLELFLDRYPAGPRSESEWELPKVDCGDTLVPLEDVKQFAHDEETFRSMRRRLSDDSWGDD